MKFLKNIALAISLLSIIACEEVIDFDLNTENEKVVIEAVIQATPTNDTIPAYVKVSKTKPYLGNYPTPWVNDAQVVITDDLGNSHNLTRVSDGYYKSTDLLPQIGRKYHLSVTVDGKVYESNTEILPITPIDTVGYNYEEQNTFRDEGYYPVLFSQEPADEVNFYRWNLYKGYDLSKPFNDYLIIADDELVEGNYIIFEFDVTYQLGDTVILEMGSLNKDAYEFLESMDSQLNNGGTPFDGPPANLLGNISNDAFGYFSGSAIVRDTVVIK